MDEAPAAVRCAGKPKGATGAWKAAYVGRTTTKTPVHNASVAGALSRGGKAADSGWGGGGGNQRTQREEEAAHGLGFASVPLAASASRA